jgi:flavin reductase (DIM6/NTAB) family NADH-FMN oxidoreductase RutF
VSSLQAAFTRITSALQYPMLIVTVADRSERAGCLVGFSTQCSIHPPRFLICISDKNRTCRVAARSDTMAVHFVPAAARPLAELFGSETGDEIAKFDHCAWHPGPGEVPILDDCPRWLAGTVVDRSPVGDHVAHVLEVTHAQDGDDVPLLGFAQVKSLVPGHEP